MSDQNTPQQAAADGSSGGVTLDPDLARRKAEAEANKIIAEAEKAIAEARAAQVAALIPDFSKVERGETTVAGEQPLFASVLAHEALGPAVGKLLNDVRTSLDNNDVVLITEDPDLASTDAAYAEVTSGIAQLIRAADNLLDTPQAEIFGAGAGAAVSAIAAAVPALVSVSSARRAVLSQTATIDATAALAATASALLTTGCKVQIDDFRLIPQSGVFASEADLRRKRNELLGRKLELQAQQAESELERTSHQTRVDQLVKLLDKPHGETSAEDRKRWETDIPEALKARDLAAAQAQSASASAGAFDALVNGIDAFVTSLHAVPTGGKRSPIVLAALREQLRDPAGQIPAFTKVLFVKAASGSANQVLDDKPLLFKDKLHVVAAVSLAYWLLDPVMSNIIDAGVATGSADLKIRVGSEFKIQSGAG